MHSHAIAAPRELTSGEAAAAAGVSRSTLKRYAEAGIVAGRRLPSGHWRFTVKAVEEFRAKTGVAA